MSGSHGSLGALIAYAKVRTRSIFSRVPTRRPRVYRLDVIGPGRQVWRQQRVDNMAGLFMP